MSTDTGNPLWQMFGIRSNEVELLKDWTTVTTFATRADISPPLARSLFDDWMEHGALDQHDDTITGVKYRLREEYRR